MSISVCPASASEVEELSVVGAAAYAAEYSDIWIDARGMASWMTAFRPSALAQAIGDPEARLWALKQDGQIVGFCLMRLNSPNTVDPRPAAAELKKLYILPGAQGLGLGKEAIKVAEAEAKAVGMTNLWLDVMDTAGALVMYRRQGFEEVGRVRLTLPLKAGREGMVVLCKDLA